MLFAAFATLAACDKKIDNETTRLVLSTGELDGVFNPFFSSSATDGNIVGMTQLSMLSADKEGKVAYGEDEACVVLDYELDEAKDKDGISTYRFVLKNNIKFSNGTPLTMKDVLFNLYVYLDPAYTGSSTIYSTDIVGLGKFRTQQDDEDTQKGFEAKYEQYAWDRIERLAGEIERMFTGTGKILSDEEVKEALQGRVNYYQNKADSATSATEREKMLKYTTMVKDYERTKELYRKELEEDYKLSIGTAEDIKFNEDKIQLETDVEAFLANEGLIYWDEDANNGQGELIYVIGSKNTVKNWTREQAIKYVYERYVDPQSSSLNLTAVLYGSNTTNTLVADFTAAEKEEYFKNLEGSLVTNVEGIKFINRTAPVEVKGKTYAVPTYNEDGSVKNDTCEVLEIKINSVDPKAIWNFGFTVAPMYYYSSPEEIANFDYEKHFGVAYGSPKFMNDYVNAPSKNGLPVGAGPYKATTKDGNSSKVDASTFWENNVVYFERNEHFLLGPAKIKYVNYQVVSEKQMLESLFNEDIHFVEPQAKQENINEVRGNKSKGFDYGTVMTNGYGYIGINAEKVPDHYVRQAIMYAIDTQLCLDYYVGYSYAINRPMTRASWAYPKDTDDLGQYYKFDSTGKTSEELVSNPEKGGFTKNAKGIYEKTVKGKKQVLEYTFTIAGDSDEHPAYLAMITAADILNAHGFKIKVEKDRNALKKLNTGDLTVWAAAWGSGVDPDMYQVYHIDSLAGSTQNWGYRAIRRNSNGLYDYELDLVNKLSVVIDQARETTDEDARIGYYAIALDYVMELAVELPTYQRSDMFAYNTKIIDASTLTPASELTPYNGPLAKLWEVSLNESK